MNASAALAAWRKILIQEKKRTATTSDSPLVPGKDLIPTIAMTNQVTARPAKARASMGSGREVLLRYFRQWPTMRPRRASQARTAKAIVTEQFQDLEEELRAQNLTLTPKNMWESLSAVTPKTYERVK